MPKPKKQDEAPKKETVPEKPEAAKKKEPAPQAKGLDLAEAVEVVTPDGEEDSGDNPGNLPPVEPKAKPENDEGVKDSGNPPGQPAAVEPAQAEDPKQVAAAISKANEKTLRELEMVAGLLRDNPEKLAELKEQNPKLYERLERRVPDLFIQKAIEPEEEKVHKLSNMLEEVLSQQEKRDFDQWRERNRISKADFSAREEKFTDTARTLWNEGLVKDWDLALKMAGNIVFPHLDSKPVDEQKLDQLGGQDAGVSRVHADESGLTQDDERIMRREGMSKEDYLKAQSGEYFAPGIL